MECNKDEATKAKNLAERSMEDKDFVRALRFALKAQQLHRNLADISKIILVCDVLCKEQNDWYAILKIEPTADEATIRKQYRKFVLSLHPDKNKFPGASDAFHLVNEAHRTLLDRELRLYYDLELQVKTKVRPQSRKKSNTARYPQEQNANENVAPQCTNKQDQQNHQSVDNTKTFWTACTDCLTRYKYYEETMGKQLNCRVCNAVFTALQTNLPCSPQGVAASLNRQASQYTHKMFHPRVAVPRDDDKGKTSNVKSMFEKMGSAEENSCSKMEFQRDGEENHSEPNNEHIPPFNESFKAKIRTSSNVESISGKKGSSQENSCWKMEFRPLSCQKSNSPRDPQEQKVNENVAPRCTDQQNHQSVDNRKTFWTACSACRARFMYYVEAMGKQLQCKICKKVFTAVQKKCPTDRSPQGEATSLNCQTSQSTHKMANSRVQVRRNYDNKKIFKSDDGLTDNFSEDLNPKGNTSNVESMLEKMVSTRENSSMLEKMLSAQENSCSNMKFQRDGEDSHSEPNHGDIPPSSDCFKAKIGTYAKVGSAQENSCSNMEFQRAGEVNHSEPSNGHIPPFNESLNTKIGTSSNVESMSGKIGSAQETSCWKMEFQRDGEDNHSEPKNRHVPPFNESFKANIETSHVKSTVEGPTNLDKLDSGIQKKRQRSGSMSDCEETSCGNRFNVHHKMTSTKENPTHKDNDVESAFQDNLHLVPNAEEIYEYPAPDFCSFSDLRAQTPQSVFEKGQIWAVYDTLDAMPRFYALIRKVSSPKFKVELVWLEPDPDDEEETKWVEKGLPASCGKFRYGNSDEIQELSTFSHLVYWEKGSTDGTFEVHPRKGETWALYKDWDISWHAHSETKKNYAYEFVEVLSDYANGKGTYVAFLYKVEGFQCIFSRERKGTTEPFLIPAKKRFRFSHRVRSFKMADTESKGFAGSFELDPASLPFNMNESLHPNPVVMEFRKMHCSLNSTSTKDVVLVDEKANSEGDALKAKLRKDGICEGNAQGFVEVEGNPEIDSNSQDLREVYPNFELEFYNFQESTCPRKFQIGQIWAMYCDEDGLPRYYCKITGVDPSPMFNLYVRWFMACSPPEGMISWVDNEMLTAVGDFKLVKVGRPRKYSNTDPFSHLVRAEPTNDKDVYSIFPKKDQIWALYKNWNPGLNLSSLDDCEYEIVRVVEENHRCILVSVLKPVKVYKSVFRPEVERQPNHAVEISKTEILRFSHQIPAFQLTKEIGGSLRGFWELDAAALPRHLLNQ